VKLITYATLAVLAWVSRLVIIGVAVWATFYLIRHGYSHVWVVWIFFGVPGFALPFWTPIWLQYLILWIVAGILRSSALAARDRYRSRPQAGSQLLAPPQQGVCIHGFLRGQATIELTSEGLVTSSSEGSITYGWAQLKSIRCKPDDSTILIDGPPSGIEILIAVTDLSPRSLEVWRNALKDQGLDEN